MSSSFKSQKATIDSITLTEKLTLIPIILNVVTNVFTAVLTGAVRSKKTRGNSLFRYVVFTAIRTFTRRASARQLALVNPPTDTSYRKMCVKLGLKPESEVLEDGTQAHWIGDKNAEKIIINFHGGGFVNPPSPGMFMFMHEIVKTLKAEGKSIAVLWLSYDLAPGAIYPRQLQQATALLKHVVENLSIAPENIFLTGDSAGANLALSLLSHIAHPWHENNTDTPPGFQGKIPALELSAPLRGLALISPWVSFSISEPSFKRNEYTDCVGIPAGVQWSEAFMNSKHPHKSNSDFYNEAATAPASWWKDLPVQETLVVAGEREVLVDGIRKFVEVYGEGYGKDKLEVFVAEHEYHDQPSLDLGLGYKDSGEQAKKVKYWLSSRA